MVDLQADDRPLDDGQFTLVVQPGGAVGEPWVQPAPTSWRSRRHSGSSGWSWCVVVRRGGRVGEAELAWPHELAPFFSLQLYDDPVRGSRGSPLSPSRRWAAGAASGRGRRRLPATSTDSSRIRPPSVQAASTAIGPSAAPGSK